MSERTDLYTMVNVLKLRSLTTVIFTCSFAKLPEGSPEADWLMGGWEGRQGGGREGGGQLAVCQQRLTHTWQCAADKAQSAEMWLD